MQWQDKDVTLFTFAQFTWSETGILLSYFVYTGDSDEQPFTVDQLFSALLPYATKWQSLGKALSLSDDQLDEIFTNNEMEEACLQKMLELYMKRSDIDQSWKEINAALNKVRKNKADGFSSPSLLLSTDENVQVSLSVIIMLIIVQG